MAITDGAVTEYFLIDGILSGVGHYAVISGSITNSYTAEAAKVQLLRMTDPDYEPTSYYNNIDSIARYGIKNMVNQIDYSS